MGKVIEDQSISLDGFTTGPNPNTENPIGGAAERLHAWMFGGGSKSGRNAEIRDAFFAKTGAVLMERRMFEPTGYVPIDVEHTRVIESPEVIHLTYRFNKTAQAGQDRNVD